MENSINPFIRFGIKKTIAGGVLLLTAICLFGLLALVILIGAETRSISRQACATYPGERTQAVIALLEDENAPLTERNRAAWALGQLGDRAALPALKKHLTGQQCDHERELCQHELVKAIKLIESDFNPLALIWRHDIFLN